jgi:hypothetical protein
MDKACSTYGVGGEVHTGFWWGCQRVRDHWEGPDVGRGIILKLISRRIRWKGISWIDLAQNRKSWRKIVNAVMNLRVP